MEFELLGPLEVRHQGRALPIAGHRTRLLLCTLLLDANQAVPTDQLIDALWGTEPPAGALHALQVHVSKLRAALRVDDDDVLISAAPRAYRLQLDGHGLDTLRFERLVAQGRQHLAAGDASNAVATLRSAEALWRGPPLAEFARAACVQPAVNRLGELHRTALDMRLEAQLMLGESASVVAELEGMAAADPLREQLCRLLMVALYRSGQQARALEIYRQTRDLLAEELGIDPSRELQQVMQSILIQDPALHGNATMRNLDLETPVIAHSPPAILPAKDPARLPRAGPAAIESRRARPGRRRRVGRRGAVMAALITLAGVIIAATITVIHSRSATRSTAKVRQANVVSEIDQTGRLRGQIDVGRNPSAIATGQGSLWVTNAGDGTLSRVEPDTLRPSAVIAGVGRDPTAVVVGGGSAWVVSPTDNTVTAVNPQTNLAVGVRVEVGQRPSGITYGAGRIWVTNTTDATISTFAPADPSAVRTFDAGTAPSGIAVSEQAVWVTNAGDDTVWKIDPTSGRQEKSIPVGLDPTAVAVGPSGVWVLNHLDGTITHIDPDTGVVQDTIRVGDGPSAIALTPGSVWVATEYAAQLVRIDPATNQVAERLPMPGAPRAITTLGNRLWLASATSNAGHRGGTLRVRVASVGSIGEEFPIIDPSRGGDFITVMVSAITTDTLLTYARLSGPAGNALVPDLATALPPPKPETTEYVFQLRTGIRFSTGAPLLASDIRASIERSFRAGPGAQDPGLATIVGAGPCISRPSTCDLSGGILTDDTAGTVRFHLSRPNALFLSSLANNWVAVVPRSTTLSTDVTRPDRPVPGTGPYKVSRFVPRRLIELRRNPYFHQWSRAAQPDGYPDAIVIDIAPHSMANVHALERGDIDYLDDQDLSPAQVQLTAASHPVVLKQASRLATSYAFLNTRVPPFNNILARRALNYAVDRTEAIRERGTSQPLEATCQILPPGMPGFRPYCPYTLNPDPVSGHWTAPDLAKAKELVKKSGTLGQPVTVWEPPTTVDPPAAYFVKLLNELGYHAHSHPPFSSLLDYFDRIQRGDAQIGMLGNSFAPRGDDGVQALTCGSLLNVGRYCNPKIDAEYKQGLALEQTDPPAARALWHKIDTQLVDAAALVPVWNPGSSVLISERVGNWQSNDALGPLVDQLWVD